ncbi:TetR family transcriptional regulator [Rhodococcus pyridinivorans]|uniref:TetR family transcriptional regulator n=1 Tax=Rhodococcus pyridinivorans TaxID=103816 RepID=UPI001E64B78A|nr:TetR family transcriptional regulator [Rhodococcus pyridinivorans]MCD2142071.1 TetR/AcrR family transcriptional regulator [Rhodococcus pyridinivorans]
MCRPIPSSPNTPHHSTLPASVGEAPDRPTTTARRCSPERPTRHPKEEAEGRWTPRRHLTRTADRRHGAPAAAHEGPKAVTIEAVANVAGMARTTIYRRYRDRSEMLRR